MLVLGHRGEPRIAPENTIVSFALIRDDMGRGVNGAECDVQMTKDGELVVIHDEKVDRTTDGQGWVKDFTLLELRKLNPPGCPGRPDFAAVRLARAARR